MEATHRRLDQERAEFAREAVHKAHQELGSAFKEYAKLAKKFPALLMRNGLGTAYVFLKSKSKGRKGRNAHTLLAENLSEWLCRRCRYSPYRGKSDLLEAVTRSSSTDYLWAAREALAMLHWLRLLASAEEEEEVAGGKT